VWGNEQEFFLRMQQHFPDFVRVEQFADQVSFIFKNDERVVFSTEELRQATCTIIDFIKDRRK